MQIMEKQQKHPGGRPKMLGGVVCSTLRTFLADNAGIGLCSRPQ